MNSRIKSRRIIHINLWTGLTDSNSQESTRRTIRSHIESSTPYKSSSYRIIQNWHDFAGLSKFPDTTRCSVTAEVKNSRKQQTYFPPIINLTIVHLKMTLYQKNWCSKYQRESIGSHIMSLNNGIMHPMLLYLDRWVKQWEQEEKRGEKRTEMKEERRE